MDDTVNSRGNVETRKRTPAREHFIENHTDGKNVAARIDRLAPVKDAVVAAVGDKLFWFKVAGNAVEPSGSHSFGFTPGGGNVFDMQAEGERLFVFTPGVASVPGPTLPMTQPTNMSGSVRAVAHTASNVFTVTEEGALRVWGRELQNGLQPHASVPLGISADKLFILRGDLLAQEHRGGVSSR